jgi:hypothetical protein
MLKLRYAVWRVTSLVLQANPSKCDGMQADDTLLGNVRNRDVTDVHIHTADTC